MIQVNKKMILVLLFAGFTCACAVTPGSLGTTPPASPVLGGAIQDTPSAPPQTSVAGPLPTPTLDSSTSLPTTPVVITPDARETPSASPTTDTGFPVQPKPGVVTIALGQTTFPKGQAITGMIQNGLPETIYSADMKTDCSIVALEQLNNGSWKAVQGCISLRAPRIVEIGTMRGQPISIDPLSTNFEVDPTAKTPAFGAGTYRLKFTYRLAPEPEGEEPLAVFSETFAVQP